MTIGWLDGFLAVARTGNFSRAAETLFITQPALSRTIAELEQTVGCKLFLRSQRPVALTPQGEVFYRWARTIEHDLSEMEAEMSLACRGVIGRLRIGYYGEPQIAILNEGIERLKEYTPEIKWSIRRDRPSQLENLLFREEIDATFLHLPHAKAFDWMDYVTVIPCGLAALLPVGHPMAGRSVVSMTEMAEEPYVAFPREISPYAYDVEMQAFRQAGAIPRVSALVEDIEALGVMVAGGSGFTLMSRSSAEELQRNGLPVAIADVEGFTDDFDLVLAWKRGIKNPYRDAFCDAIRFK